MQAGDRKRHRFNLGCATYEMSLRQPQGEAYAPSCYICSLDVRGLSGTGAVKSGVLSKS